MQKFTCFALSVLLSLSFCIPAAAAGVVAGVIVALAGGSLFTVAISASAVVYVLLLIL